jgi:putative DNA-invertase from lambdoid prophage Rac
VYRPIAGRFRQQGEPGARRRGHRRCEHKARRASRGQAVIRHAARGGHVRRSPGRGVVIKTVINGMTFDGSTADPMQQAVRDALIAFMAATAQAQAEATKSAQRAGIDHKRRAQPNAYLGRKPPYDRAMFDRIKLTLHSQPAEPIGHRQGRGLVQADGIRLKQDRQAALDAVVAWGL